MSNDQICSGVNVSHRAPCAKYSLSALGLSSLSQGMNEAAANGGIV
jgi:hypothetical protein